MNNLDCAKAYIEDALNNYDDYSKNQILNNLNSALMFLNSVIANISDDNVEDKEHEPLCLCPLHFGDCEFNDKGKCNSPLI